MSLKFLVSASAMVLASMAGAETTLTYGSTLPAPHLAHREGLEPFFERVSEATNGELKFDLLPGSALGSVKEAVQMLEDNVADAGLLLDVFTRQELPITSMYDDLIVVADDFIVFAAASNEYQLVVCEDCQAERTAKNIVSMAYYAPDPYRLMCRDDTSTFEQLQNKKTRATGRNGMLLQALGATTVTITSAEVYESIQRGQADCTVASAAWLESYNLKDVVKTVVDLPMGTYFNAGIWVMNLETWQGLPEDQQKTMQDNMAELVVDMLFTYRDESESALAAAKAAGVTVVEPDQALRDGLAEFRKGEIEHAIEAAANAGVDNAEERIDTFLALVEKWRGIMDEVGDDRAAFIAALNREVYSKAKF